MAERKFEGLFPEVRTKLHPAWLRRLKIEWQSANDNYLGRALKMPVFAIDVAAEARLGQWQPAARVLSISEQHILRAPWVEVRTTLRHELAHQYVTEILKITDETSHGPAFVATCRRLHASPSASGLRDGGVATETSKILQRVQKLLALADNDNAHEAEAAMAAANKLLLEYNLQHVVRQEEREYQARLVGKAAGAFEISAKLVAAILSEFFFVECIWVSTYDARRDQDQRQLELMGSETNLELAHYVHDFLHRECDTLWQRGQTHLGASDRSSKREFKAGVLMGFRDKLRSERKVSAERGLVWVADPGLVEYTRERYPRLTTMSGSGISHSSALSAGREAGSKLTVHKGVSQHSARGRLLGRG
jgi:hypothetical protein